MGILNDGLLELDDDALHQKLHGCLVGVRGELPSVHMEHGIGTIDGVRYLIGAAGKHFPLQDVVLWPEQLGFFNTQGGAVLASRRAARQWRNGLCVETAHVQSVTTGRSLDIDRSLAKSLLFPRYPTKVGTLAARLLREERLRSVAVSPRVCLQRTAGSLCVLSLAGVAGELVREDGEFVLCADGSLPVAQEFVEELCRLLS